MAKKKPRDAGEEFIQGILEKIPEEKREQVKELFSSDDVLSFAGERVLMRDEFSRAMDGIKTRDQQLKARQEQLDDWWEANSAALTEHPKLKKEVEELRKKLESGATGGDDLGDDDDALKKKLEELTAQMVTKEDGTKVVKDAVMQSEGRLLHLLSKTQPLAHRHAKDFDEPLDVQGLVEFAVKHKINDLDDAYSKFYSDKLAEKQEKLTKQKEEELRKSIRREVEEEARKAGTPYPLPGREGGGASTLLGLSNKEAEASQGGIKAAIDEYYRQGQQ